MSDIEKVKKLREATGAGFKDCNLAIKESGGDLDKAVEILRVKGISKASKKMSRDAKEGVVAVSGDQNKTSIIEVNCETDFVAKNNDFINFVKELSELNNQNNSDIEKLKKSKMKNDICCTTSYGQWYGHTHNLPIEMALNYGLFFSSLVSVTLIYIYIKSFKKIFIKKTRTIDIDTKNLLKFEKAWWICSFSLFFSQLFDLQYYDLRISLIFWILISGLISKLQENKSKLIISKKVKFD